MITGDVHQPGSEAQTVLLDALARTMTRAYGLDPAGGSGSELVQWWLERAVVRRPARDALPV